ncbi:MAG TPA: hypothetical protein VJH37_03960 [Candidatus Nanoarchaeia archaeon]|nr:hypothetical protein [Candidatus Nanoarchaeia archaeon]
MQNRQTAYKLWIAEIVNADYIRNAGEWEPNYLDIKGIRVARVNILGIITDVFTNLSKDYGTITLEDGSASIAVRAFKEDIRLFVGCNIGDAVLIIGRPKQYQNEIYLIPEIVKKVENSAWMKVRKAELVQTRGDPQPKQAHLLKIESETKEAREELIATNGAAQGNEGSRQKILNLLEKQGEQGMDIDVLIQAADTEEEVAEKIIEELIKEGEIYMSRPGVLKII